MTDGRDWIWRRTVNAGMIVRAGIVIVALIATTDVRAAGRPDADLGKQACAVEARRLCPAEMRSFSRKKVEACMIAKIDQTSQVCHAAMLRIKAERENARKR